MLARRVPLVSCLIRTREFRLLTDYRVASVGHAPLSFIVELNQKLRPEYLICFDQSYHRKHSLSKKGQMEAKLTFLHEKGMHAFYYVSHASFLFIAQKKPVLRTTSETSS